MLASRRNTYLCIAAAGCVRMYKVSREGGGWRTMETLKEKTAKGLLWGGINSFALQVVGLVFGIILARLLSPEDYGMIAMVGVFSAIAGAAQESGFRVALTNMKHPTHDDYNAVFWFNVIVGALMYGLLYMLAPLLGRFYHNVEVVPLSRFVLFAVFVSTFGIAQSAYLFRRLKAKQQAKASIAAVLLSSAVGVVMAYKGCRYWALATQSLVYVAVNVVMQWHYSPWRPTLRHVTLRPIARMFPFSCKLLATTIATYVNNNVLNLLLGRFFTAHATGCYSQANTWSAKCYNVVMSAMMQVTLPVLAELQDDEGRQLNAFRKIMRFTAFFSFPLLLGLGLVSQEFIVIALGEKWLESARLLQIVCVGGAVLPLSQALSNMVVSNGRSGTYLCATVALGLLQIVVLVAMRSLGLTAMVAVYVLINVAWVFVWFVFVHRLTRYTLVAFLRDTVPFAAAAAAVMVAVHYVTLPITSLWVLLAARVVLAAALYYAVMRLAGAKILAECIAFARNIVKK